MKKTIKYMLIIMFIFSLSACKKTENPIEPTKPIDPIEFNLSEMDVYKYTFRNQDENMMPIGVWSDPPPANFAGVYDNLDLINDQQYQYIKESGVNAVYGLYNNIVLNKDGVLRSLALADKYDLTYLVRDSQVTGSYEDDDYNLLTKTLNQYKDYESFAGTMVTDEPGVLSFDDLGNLHKNYKQYLPEHAFYINMLPDYATSNQLINGASGGVVNDDTMDYERYMTEYLNKVSPEFYSYDFYPFTGLNYGNMRSGYFDQMAQIRNATSTYGIPFWTFIQASSWSPTGLRVPNQTEIYWQVSTSIAMGAKGIQYFMYYTSMEGNGIFSGGMVDVNGNKNPMYDYVKNANMHLINIQNVIMNSTQVGVIVHGDSPDEVPESVQIDHFSILNSYSGDDMLIGAFNYNQKPAYYVVNNSLFNETGTHTLTFDTEVTIGIYEDDGYREVTTSEITLSIGAGEGVLVEIIS